MKTYNFKATLLSGTPLEGPAPYSTGDPSRPFEVRMSRFVFDYDSLIMKANVDMDDNHNSNEILGRTDVIVSEDGKLKAKGRIFSSVGDRAERISELAKQGVLFGISPKVCFLNSEAINIPEGSVVEVNGRAYAGPITVFTKAEILGFGICPYATDRDTQFEIEVENENL